MSLINKILKLPNILTLAYIFVSTFTSIGSFLLALLILIFILLNNRSIQSSSAQSFLLLSSGITMIGFLQIPGLVSNIQYFFKNSFSLHTPIKIKTSYLFGFVILTWVINIIFGHLILNAQNSSAAINFYHIEEYNYVCYLSNSPF